MPSVCVNNAPAIMRDHQYLRSTIPKVTGPITHNHHILSGSSTGYYFVQDYCIKHYNLETHRITTILEQDDQSTLCCYTVGQGFVALITKPGFGFNVSIKQLSSSAEYKGSINSICTNAVISKHRLAPSIITYGNDGKLRVRSLPRVLFVQDYQLPAEINHVSISRDHRQLLAVGESDTFWHFKSVDGTLELAASFKDESHNSALRCCWNSNSTKIAVGYADGATVWDVSNSQKIAEISTGIRIRKVLFSSSPVDLLLVAANCKTTGGSLTIVDARTFDGQQVVKLESLVGQIWFSTDGKQVMAALHGRVCLLDIDLTRRRCFSSGGLT